MKSAINGNRRELYEDGLRPSSRPNFTPPPPEEILKVEDVTIERKVFQITHRKNHRGDFLRIVEDCKGRFNCIIIPGTGIADFKAALDRVVATVPTPEKK